VAEIHHNFVTRTKVGCSTFLIISYYHNTLELIFPFDSVLFLARHLRASSRRKPDGSLGPVRKPRRSPTKDEQSIGR
jgi:hypothetical protein